MTKIRKRLLIVSTLIMVGMLLLNSRLMQIQLISTESFSDNNINLIEASVKQRTQEMIIDDGRGKLVDRNGESLLYTKSNRLVLFPFLKEMDWPVEEIAALAGLSPYVLTEAVKKMKEPTMIGGELSGSQMEEINRLQTPGVFAVPIQEEQQTTVADHIVGITAESKEIIEKNYKNQLKKGEISITTPVGISGLQRSFDEFLLPEQESKLLYHVDRRGGPLFGIDVKYTGAANPFYPVNIQTTVDVAIQKRLEEVMNRSGLKEGGFVLLDVETSEVVAMTSRPSINKKNPYNNEKSIVNRMLTPQMPGSIFKTVIAAAAIEQNLVQANELYNCDYSIHDKILPAKKKQGLLNFTDSFAESCNRTFSDLAKKMSEKDPEMMDEYAHKLGLTELVGWNGDVFHFEQFRQFDQEARNTIWHPDDDKKDVNLVKLAAIGQRNVKLTPLSVANMMATIARGGKKQTVKIVDEIQYKNGGSLYTFHNQKMSGNRISPYTALQLQRLLKEVVIQEKGTGRRFQTLPYTVAGKSGTADIRVNAANKEIVNKWFAGYFPVENPKYALVVVDLNTFSDTSPTNQIFYEIVKELYEMS
ncbi:peptidoglycan D,D-transpeptidase FtsI family protein [Metabacillus iocasae]|uniref:serine-type D-Ala-D-Ala carboxypeptidase n=1 Tax=Priestia iocasae TaxID=2291674 RepID=A0ABS2QRP8_9BACI|nr:penicillin-binding transpeptidase domain-containing protein [Metabacillus iocasae]MBM7701431.1 cell division protein FtsI/penicillin-binding protein 2 [Metabacillus iocasae]